MQERSRDRDAFGKTARAVYDELVTHYQGRDAKARLTNAVKITPADTSALNVEYDFVVTDDDFGNVEDFDNAGRGKN